MMPPRCAPVLPAAVYRGQKCRRIKRSFGIGTQVLEKLGGGTHVRNVGGNLIWLGKEQHETKSLEICGGITDISTRLESSAHSRYAYMSEVLLFSIGERRHVLHMYCLPLMVATEVNMPDCRCCKPHKTHCKSSSVIFLAEQCP